MNRPMLMILREQALQQAHDLFDTIEAIEKFSEPTPDKPTKTESVMTWIDYKDEQPLDGERVVIDDNGTPYFYTYMKGVAFNEKITRWLRLPE